MSSHGYIYVTGWDRFQHYKNRRPTWIKLYLDLLENDAYLDLTASDRCLLQTVWMCSAEYGNGRVSADQVRLRGRAKLRKGNLESLVQAGFITIRASKALAEVLVPESETDVEGTTDQSTLPLNGQPTPSSTPALELVFSADHQEINAKDIDPDTRFAIEHLLTALSDQDDGTIGRLVTLARKGAGPADFHDARQAVTTTTPRSPSRVACTTIENRLATRSTA